MIASFRRRTMPALFTLALSAGAALAVTAAPAMAQRAWVQTETLLLDRPGHDGRMVGQYLTCDEVRIVETRRGWTLVSGRRGGGWVQNAMLARFEPAGCRYDFRAFRSVQPHFPVFPERPPHWGTPDRPPRPEPAWPREPAGTEPYWGP